MAVRDVNFGVFSPGRHVAALVSSRSPVGMEAKVIDAVLDGFGERWDMLAK